MFSFIRFELLCAVRIRGVRFVRKLSQISAKWGKNMGLDIDKL